MTRDDVIRMAREAGLLIPSFRIGGGLALGSCTVPDFERFASIVAAAEREAYAKETKKLFAQPTPSVPREAIEKMLTQLMDIAVSNGANSVSMPDEYVEVAAWLCGIPAQPAPSFADAYQGAMEEVAIWKKRALEAEDLNRKFVAEINGPTYMGEPPHSKPDCGEAGHDEGRCGNRQCLPGAKGE